MALVPSHPIDALRGPRTTFSGPQALRPAVHLPESLTALLMRALEKNRDRRFQTAEEFIASMNKPHVVAAATAVLGSDALNAPTAATRRQTPPSATARKVAANCGFLRR